MKLPNNNKCKHTTSMHQMGVTNFAQEGTKICDCRGILQRARLKPIHPISEVPRNDQGTEPSTLSCLTVSK